MNNSNSLNSTGNIVSNAIKQTNFTINKAVNECQMQLSNPN